MKSLQIAPVCVLFLQIIANVEAANILGMFLSYSPSHLIVQMGTVRALVEQGHNVTIITSLPLKDKIPGLRHIFLKTLDTSQQESNGLISGTKDNNWGLVKVVKTFMFIKQMFHKYSQFKRDPAFVDFMREDNHFDLMLLGYAFNEYQLGLAAHFKCPVVLMWVLQPYGHLNRLIGNPTHTEFVPFLTMDPKPMDFVDRFYCFLVNIIERIFSGLLEMLNKRIYPENFPLDKYPSLVEMQNNISLVLVNHHFSEGPIRPMVPGIVEIGGITIKDKPDPLSEDLSKFIENSPNGVIFFSLGSNLKPHHLGPKFIETAYNTLSTLPYNVIWKFDSDSLPGNASNILYRKWLPQDDILAHKNVKLFITHAGKGGVTESEYHHVPMVALPIFADQLTNAQTLQAKGHGIALDYATITEDSFRAAILEVMENDKYRNTIRRFSEIYRDRPLTARQNAVYWIEYVIRHKGAPHMQSPLKTMNFFQENSIDVILCFGLVLYFAFRIVKFSFLVGMFIVRKSFILTKQKGD